MKKILISTFILVIAATSQAVDILREDSSGYLYADLRDARLTEVTKFIKTRYGIEFKGDEFLFQNTVTVSFKKLSLEKVMDRLFSKMNYSVTYDSKGNISEVKLLQNGDYQTATEEELYPVIHKTAKNFHDPEIAGEIPQEIVFIEDAVNSYRPENDHEKNQLIGIEDQITSFEPVFNARHPGE